MAIEKTTVGELMKELAKYPPETRVLGRGYENGYNDVTMGEGTVVPCHGDWYDGDYDVDMENREDSFLAVILA